MLKISKAQFTKGQKIKINLDESRVNNIKNALNRGGTEWEFGYMKRIGFEDGDIITLEKLSGTEVTFSIDGKTHKVYWSVLKNWSELVGENLGSMVIEYEIRVDGKNVKKKRFQDMGKVKASLMSLMNYHELFYNEAIKHKDNCPEAISTSPELAYGEVLPRSSFEKMEIVKIQNKKEVGVVEDFDPLAYYDEQMFLLNVSAKFGSSVREVFKVIKPEHQYIFVFFHEDYTNGKNPYYEYLTESQIIKDALKSLKLKGVVKRTKYGKTSIAVTHAIDALKLSKATPNYKHLILDINGNQLEEAEDRLVIMENRKSVIGSLLDEEFEA
jgi:hypothetical protein